MRRLDITQSAALQAIVDLLRNRLGLNERNCFVVEAEDYLPKIPISGDYWLTIAADEGRFPNEEQAESPGPNSISNLSEDGGFVVSGYSRLQTDSTDHAGYLYHDAKRGLLEIKRKILWAFLGDVTGYDPTTFNAETGEKYAFVRNMIYAIRATRPGTWKHPDSSLPLGRIQVTFGLDFDWDLSGGQ